MVDLQTEAILAAEVYRADQADSAALIPSLERAEASLERAEIVPDIEKVVADSAYPLRPFAATCIMPSGRWSRLRTIFRNLRQVEAV